MEDLKSEKIDLLINALFEAKKLFTPVKKTGFNPHFKSSFPTLQDAINATKEGLERAGLVVIQTTGWSDGGTYVRTIVLHTSGQWLCGELPLSTTKPDPQSQGSALSYARRYAYMGMLGLAAEDDDAETAMARSQQANTTRSIKHPQEAPISQPRANQGHSHGGADTNDRVGAVGAASQYVIKFGKHKDKTLEELGLRDALNYAEWLEKNAGATNKPMGSSAKEFIEAVEAYHQEVRLMQEQERTLGFAPGDLEVPF